jgi:uncharacterized protein (DUF2267 family)
VGLHIKTVTYPAQPQSLKKSISPCGFGCVGLSTKILSLDRAIQNTVQWLNDIQHELGWEDRDTVYKATKAVLQAIRDRLPFEEVAHFNANLPLIMKGMMIDGYDTKDKPTKMHSVEEFDQYVQQYYDSSRRDLIDSEEATQAVVRVLNRRMGGGEMQKVAANMPDRIRRLFEPALLGKRQSRELEVSP